jgi:hypothetical protein
MARMAGCSIGDPKNRPLARSIVHGKQRALTRPRQEKRAGSIGASKTRASRPNGASRKTVRARL